MKPRVMITLQDGIAYVTVDPPDAVSICLIDYDTEGTTGFANATLHGNRVYIAFDDTDTEPGFADSWRDAERTYESGLGLEPEQGPERPRGCAGCGSSCGVADCTICNGTMLCMRCAALKSARERDGHSHGHGQAGA